MPLFESLAPVGGIDSLAPRSERCIGHGVRIRFPGAFEERFKPDYAMTRDQKIRSIVLILLGLLLMFLAASMVLGSENDLAGLWKGTNCFSRITAEVSQHGDRIDGVLTVLGPFHGRDVYHFTGICREGRITASHYTGHAFQGRLSAPGKVCGVLTTRTGMKLQVEAERSATPLHVAAGGTREAP